MYVVFICQTLLLSKNIYLYSIYTTRRVLTNLNEISYSNKIYVLIIECILFGYI